MEDYFYPRLALDNLVSQTDLDFFWHCMGIVNALGTKFEAEVDDVCDMYIMGGEL